MEKMGLENVTLKWNEVMDAEKQKEQDKQRLGFWAKVCQVTFQAHCPSIMMLKLWLLVMSKSLPATLDCC